MKIGNREFEIKGHTYVMGILNITPDSFWDGGRWYGGHLHDKDRVLRRVEAMLAEGMDILDVGGESTRPGAGVVPEEEEMARVLPVIEAVKANFDVPVSLDTYKGNVAREGIRAGADLINDVRGLKYDGQMAEVIAKSGLPCCLMHSREQADYQCLVQDILADLSGTLRIAKQAQIAEDKIILDPGIGFGKTYEQNLEILNCLEQFQTLGFPILLGCSRKSVIGTALGLAPGECLEGTLAAAVIGVMKGCSFVRVHDVKENVRVIRMTEAILGRGRVSGKCADDWKGTRDIGMVVEVERDNAWHEAYLSVGSNMGDREAFIRQALHLLQSKPHTKVCKVSTLIETEAYGGVEQANFLNGAILVQTLLSPRKLLGFLHEIEQAAGRERTLRWGPRTLDLDILFYDSLVYADHPPADRLPAGSLQVDSSHADNASADSPHADSRHDELVIPHIDLQNRYFVLKPLSEIAPNYRHPLTGQTVRQMLDHLA